MAMYEIGFAGSGTATADDVRALMDNWLTPDIDVEKFWLPARITKRTQKGLAAVLEYLDKAWEGYNTGTPDEIMAALKQSAQEAFLVVLVGAGQQPDEVTADMIEAAWQARIPVRDLAAGLDFLDPSDDGEDSAEPGTAAAEPPAEPMTGRRGRKTPAAASRPAARTSAPRSRAPRGTARTAPADEPPFDIEVTTETPEAPGDEAAVTLAAIRAVVRDEVTQVLANGLIGAVTALQGPLGQVRAYVRDPDGTLRRRGPGKPRTGESVLYMTDLEAQEKGIE